MTTGPSAVPDPGGDSVISSQRPTRIRRPGGGAPPAPVDSIAQETGIAPRVIPLDVDWLDAHAQRCGLGVRPPGSARQGTITGARFRDRAQVTREGPRRVGQFLARHTDHCRGNAVGSLGVKLGAAPGAPPWGQVLACHLPRGQLYGQLRLVILRPLPGSPPPLRVRQSRRRHGEPGKKRRPERAVPAAWARFDPSALPADAGLGVRRPAANRGGATRQLVHNLVRPVRRATTSGCPATPSAGTRALGRTPREQRHH